jgi:hypothetical protein
VWIGRPKPNEKLQKNTRGERATSPVEPAGSWICLPAALPSTTACGQRVKPPLDTCATVPANADRPSRLRPAVQDSGNAKISYIAAVLLRRKYDRRCCFPSAKVRHVRRRSVEDECEKVSSVARDYSQMGFALSMAAKAPYFFDAASYVVFPPSLCCAHSHGSYSVQ